MKNFYRIYRNIKFTIRIMFFILNYNIKQVNYKIIEQCDNNYLWEMHRRNTIISHKCLFNEQ